MIDRTAILKRVPDSLLKGLSSSTTNHELLERYHQTRLVLLAAMDFGSQASKPERLAALERHHQTLRLIKARLPDIKYADSTAEWYLRQ